MKDVINTRITAVWLFLIVATLLSWFLDQRVGAEAFAYAGVAILIIAIIKVRFVMAEFMEIRTAPRALRLAADGWCVLICTVLTVLFVRAG